MGSLASALRLGTARAGSQAQHLPRADRWPVPWAAPPVSRPSTVGAPLLACSPGPGRWPCSGLSWAGGATRTISLHWDTSVALCLGMAGTGPSCLEGLQGGVSCSWRLWPQLGLCHPGGQPSPRHLGGTGLLRTKRLPGTPPLGSRVAPAGRAARAAGGCGQHLPFAGGRALLVATPPLLGPLWKMPLPAEQSCSRGLSRRALRLGAISWQVQGEGGPSPSQWHPCPQTQAGVRTMCVQGAPVPSPHRRPRPHPQWQQESRRDAV